MQLLQEVRHITLRCNCRCNWQLHHSYVYLNPREVARTCNVFRFEHKFNSDLCIIAPYLCAGPHKTTELRCPDQPDPRPDPNPNPNVTLTLTLTLTPNHPLGARGLLSRSAGAVFSLRANLKTLHVRAICLLPLEVEV